MGNIIPNPPPELDGWRFFCCKDLHGLCIAYRQGIPCSSSTETSCGWDSAFVILTQDNKSIPIVIGSHFVLQGGVSDNEDISIVDIDEYGFKGFLTAFPSITAVPRNEWPHKPSSILFTEVNAQYAPMSAQEMAATLNERINLKSTVDDNK